MAINLYGGKEWIETVGADDTFQGYISEWVADAKIGNLTKEDVLNAVAKIADYRKDPLLLSGVELSLG
jgi:hypothetical protein